jgi:hypothetical protein
MALQHPHQGADVTSASELGLRHALTATSIGEAIAGLIGSHERAVRCKWSGLEFGRRRHLISKPCKRDETSCVIIWPGEWRSA